MTAVAAVRPAAGAGAAGLERAERLAYLRGLFDEAAADAGLSPGRSQAENAYGLLYCVFHICGTLNLGRGWVGEFGRAFRGAGCTVPAPHTIRWYRSALAQNPLRVEAYGWPDPEVVADMLELAPD